MSIKLVLVAACALVDADGRVLLTERPAGKSMAGLWEFPGGKIEAGERPEETLIRELNEELGIVVREPCLAPLTFASHAYEDFHLLMPLYVCRRWEGIVTAAGGPEARLGSAEPAPRLQDAAGGRAAGFASDDTAGELGATTMTKIETLTPARWRCFCADESGATAIEYAMVASGIGAFLAATVYQLGGKVKTLFTTLSGMF